MKTSRRARVLAATMLLSLSLTSCDETLKLKAQDTEVAAKISALNQEKNSLEAQINALRSSLPPGGSLDESVRILYARASGELTVLESSLKAAKASLKETETSVANLKRDIAAQKPKAQ